MAIGLRERNRQAAMDSVRTVAFALMETHGFDAVTVEQIAADAHVSPSTVYRYFGTKESLVLSTSRPAQLVEHLAADDSERTALDAFQRAAVKVWGSDLDAAPELGLVAANPALADEWERQLLDQRSPVAEALALRRGAKSARTRDHAASAAALAVLMTFLLKWQVEGGGKKQLDKMLTKAYAGLA